MRKNLVIFIALALGVFLFVSVALSGMDKVKDDLFKQVSLFSDALAIIRSEYVAEINPRDLIYGALKGMLSSLDPHSQFMDPDTYNELKIDKEGKFGGLGIEITIADGLPTVVTPIEDTPAWKAGLKVNDKIVKINKELTRDMTLTEVVKRLRGKPGEAVDIIVLRESEKRLIEFKIVRDIIKIKYIKEAKILEDGIAYIRLIEFGENTAKDLRVALENLKKSGMNSIILDLRNNPGGLLDSAVRVAGSFIEKGKLIVYTQGRKESQALKFFSEENHPIAELPMVVLINEGSASGSEIVAASLQDYKRAIVVGVKSFGKGSVQTVVLLNDGSAISLTTSTYFTPLGRQINNKGVLPDILVEDGRIELKDKEKPLEDKSQEVFKELESKEKELPPKEIAPIGQQDYKSDNQLMRAVDILKAVKFYKGIK
ncbi:MAG: S41 family peptidase [Candidatus Omnitrophica bacterium]|nr:S41 family peptidase [Candidatus Omnitrophota bacterium]